MRAEVTKSGIRIIRQSKQDEKAISRFIAGNPTLLWFNGAVFGSSSGWESMYIRKLTKSELEELKNRRDG